MRATAGFQIEVGSYGIELRKDERIEIQLQGQGLNQKMESGIYRHSSMALFNTRALAEHLRSAALQKSLREKGFLQFHWDYKIFNRAGQPKEMDRFPFLLVYQPSPTRYLDPNRSHAGIDLLTRTPELIQSDLPIPSGDPRLDLSPRRAYAWDYAFASGNYGIGMLDGTSLYQAFPLWWNPSSLPSNPAEAKAGVKRALPANHL